MVYLNLFDILMKGACGDHKKRRNCFSCEFHKTLSNQLGRA